MKKEDIVEKKYNRIVTNSEKKAGIQNRHVSLSLLIANHITLTHMKKKRTRKKWKTQKKEWNER